MTPIDNDQLGEFVSPAEVRLVRLLPGPIERIWEFLTDSEKRGRWMAAGPMEPRVGGKLRFEFRIAKLAPDETPPPDFTPHHDCGYTMEATVLRWEPPRILSYTFGSSADSEVTFELTPQGAKVLLVLTHRGRGEDIENLPLFSAGWHTHTSLLIAILESHPRPPFWPKFTQRLATYTRLHKATA